MDPITLILAALAAGAGVGATEVAKTAISDAYAGLKGLILRRFGQNTQATTALAMFETNPDETIASYLRPHLVDYQLEADSEIMASAEDLLTLTSGPSAGGAGSVAITGNVAQRADRGGVAQIGGITGSITTNFTEVSGHSNGARDDRE